MNTTNDLDRRLRAALADGPSRAPERSIELALGHARTRPRRGDPLSAFRRDPMGARPARFAAMSQLVPLVALAGLALAAGLAVAAAAGVLDDPPAVPPVATPSASPSTQPSVSPSPNVLSVDLIEQVGADATIDVIDRSGRLVGAESGMPGDGASVPEGSVAVVGLPTDPSAVVLTWSGSPCDTTHRLTIDPDGLTMTIERPACEGDAIGVDHVLVLTFDRPVDASTVRAAVRTTGG